MAMSTGGNGGFNSEPNVTPMIDVLLVLLIIFMMVVPMARKAIDLQLPDPTPGPVSSAANQQLVLEISATGTYSINTIPVPPNGLEQRLHEYYDNRPDKVLFIKGDPKAKYQTIMHAIDVARGAGWRQQCQGLSAEEAKAQGCSLIISIVPSSAQ